MSKKRPFFQKLIYFINSLFALLLLVAYVIPYIKPQNLGSFAGISLLTPLLILINLGFVIYWILGINRTFLLSLIVLLIGFSNLSRFYKVAGKKVLLTDDIKIMSYNVRMFNEYKWTEADSIEENINKLIEHKLPDVLCVQEYAANPTLEKDFPYKYIKYKGDKSHFGHAIFSKYPILKKGNLKFEKTANTILFADIKIDTDTIRVYNVHLQSIGIDTKEDHFDKENATRLRNRINTAFQKQQKQVEELLAHQKTVNYPIIVAGDFNNTAFSWPYRSILKGKNDAYVEAGKGFDKTYNFAFPMRIDFIMVDERIEINHFKAYRDKLSDHYPILARLDRKSLLSVNDE